MPFSHHSHSGQFCEGHAENSLEEVIQLAIAKRMQVFALTEHMPRHDEDAYPEEIEAGWNLEKQYQNEANYFKEAIRLREKYKAQINIPIGFECDWIRPASLDLIQESLRKYPFDFFIGSVHHVHTIPIDYSDELYHKARDVAGGADEQLFEDYFDAQLDMLKALKPPVVGHFDLIRLKSDNPNQSFQRMPRVWEKVLRNLDFVALYEGILELNTASLRKGMVEPYPQADICKAFLARGDHPFGIAGISQRGAYELLSSGIFSDFTITCGDRDFKVHRSIICTDSHFFKSVADGNFKETGEAKVTLGNDDAATVARVVHFMYLGDYHVSEECVANLHTAHKSMPLEIEAMETLQDFTITIAEANGDSTKDSGVPECDLLIHAKTYQAADKWGLEHLKEVSSARFLQCLRDTSVEPTTLVEALDKVYEGTSPEDTHLRLTLTNICIQNPAAITKHAAAVAVIEKHELLSWRIGTSLLAKFSQETTEMAQKTTKIVDTLLNLSFCHCIGEKTLQGSKSLRSSSPSNDSFDMAFEPRRIEDWEGVIRIQCSDCCTVTIVDPKETI